MSSIHHATRNASVLRWWADCQPAFKRAVLSLYAQVLGCPQEELCDVETFAQDGDVLVWLALTYANTIDAHTQDHS